MTVGVQPMRFSADEAEALRERAEQEPAAAAAELLTSPQAQLVRECAGERCSWLFVDTTRNKRRRWCSMEDCGNRAKTRRFYHRHKAAD